MTAVLWSSHFETELYGLSWNGLTGTKDQWPVLLQLLSALAEQTASLGAISGDLQIVIEQSDGNVFETWPVTTDADHLRAILAARRDSPAPVELPLHIEPLLWLPDHSIEIIDFDLSDDDVVARATLQPVEHHENILHDGLKAWRLPRQPVKLLAFCILFGFDEVPTSVRLQVSTRCDLWRTTQLNGAPGEPYHLANAALLQRSIEAIARATGAEITTTPPP